MVPVGETLDKIASLFDDNMVILFQYYLTTTYLQWYHEIYEQIDGLATGNSMSPVVAKYFMDKF